MIGVERTSRPTFSLFGVFLLVWISASAARAQDRRGRGRLTEVDRVRAHQLFDRGVAAGREGDLAEGISCFIESFELFPHPGTLTNLGLFQLRARRRADAYVTFRELMTRYQTVISDTARAEVARRVEELESELAFVTLESRPGGADILLDHEVCGRTPLSDELVLEPGRHVFEAHLDGYESATRIYDLARGERARIELILRPPSGAPRAILVVDSPTEGALLRIDDGTPEPLPIERRLDPGEHELVVVAPGRESQVRRVTLPESSEVHLTVDLALASNDPIVEDRPHWRRSWPWIIVGCVLVAIGTTLGVTLSRDEPQPDWNMRVR